MGGRGSASLSANKYHTDMWSNIDADGHISLDAADYQGIAGSEVRDFLSAQSYEVYALFNDKDEVVYITSDWYSTSVTPDIAASQKAMDKDGSASFTRFHHQPLNTPSRQIFSPTDIDRIVDTATQERSNEKNAAKHLKNVHALLPSSEDARITRNIVQTTTGSTSTLTYTGVKTNSRTKTKNFASAYEQAFKSRFRSFSSEKEATRSMITWLLKNAPKYGFEFKTDFVSSER